MTTPHKATPEQWAFTKRQAEQHNYTAAMLLGLRDCLAGLEEPPQPEPTVWSAIIALQPWSQQPTLDHWLPPRPVGWWTAASPAGCGRRCIVADLSPSPQGWIDDRPTTETRYAVGWHRLTPAQLQAIPQEYREACQNIDLFGTRKPVTFPTPQEAQDFLEQIIRINSTRNLELLTGTGADALFLVEVTPVPDRADPWEAPRRRRYSQ